MRKKNHYIKFMLAITMCFGGSIYLHAQDLHYSQYFNAPLLVNPANTGFAPDVDYRVGINYRKQWASITTNPYRTFGVWGDVQLFNDRFDNGWVGLGGAILRDVAGSGGLTSTKGYGSVAYHQLVGFKSLLSAGFNVGFASKRVDFSKLTFDSQWTGEIFDNNVPNNEPILYNSVTYLDLQLGLNYAYFPTDNVYVNAGFSVMHINRPKESFYEQSVVDPRISPRFTMFLNGSFKVNDQWIVNPNVYTSKMSTAWETVAGLNAHYNLSGDGSSQLIGGIYVRLKDAFIPMFGYQWNNIAATVSYDATSSTLGTYNQTRGAYELSIVKSGFFTPGGKNVKCPTVSF